MAPRGRPGVTTYARAYQLMTRSGAPRQLREAGEAACPYRREYLKASFMAGWFAWTTCRHLPAGFEAPHLSPSAHRAWMAGHQAREQYEPNTTQEA